LWKWLSSSRFFPPGWNEDISNRQQRLRGFGSVSDLIISYNFLGSYYYLGLSRIV
jgi:hypothetical protein